MPSPSSQSSPDAHLEKLMDAFHIAAQQINLAPQLVHNSVTGSAVTRRYFAARQSLREFLSERTLTALNEHARPNPFVPAPSHDAATCEHCAEDRRRLDQGKSR